MGSPDVLRVINVPGRLCYGPSSLATAFPHGGTAIGTTRAGKLIRYATEKEIRDEAFGTEIRDVVLSGENYAFACILREWDDDAIALMFPNTAAGAVSQHKVVETPGSNRPGLLLSAKKVVLLFSPDDPERVPATLLYAALPRIAKQQEWDTAFGKRWETTVSFTAVRDSSSRIHKTGMLKDLAL